MTSYSISYAPLVLRSFCLKHSYTSLLQVSAKHLLCASVIKAPCALAVSKLLYPETETSKFGKASHLGTKEK